jgi:hypothetical protein
MYRLSYIFSVNVRVQYVHMELRHEGAQHLISVSQPNKAHNITPPRVGPGSREPMVGGSMPKRTRYVDSTPRL